MASSCSFTTGITTMIRQHLAKIDIVAEVVKQGPAYVLLCVMIWGIYSLIPELMTQIERGYARNLTELRGIADQMDHATTKVIGQLEAEHKMTDSLLRQLILKSQESELKQEPPNG